MIQNDLHKWSKKDIFSLNYIFHSPFKLVESRPDRRKNKYLIQTILLFFGTFLKALGRIRIKQSYAPSEVLFWSGSHNNDKVLKPIFKQLSAKSQYLSKNFGVRTPKHLAYFFSLPFFFKAVQIWKSTEGYDRKTFTACFDNVWLSFGYYQMVLKILKKMNPRLVIIANDHNLHGRAVIICAKKLGIKSLYVQHAGTAEHFPPLIMDYAFLDGALSHQKYKSRDPKNNAKVYEVGSPRFDDIARIRFDRVKTGRIGVAVNKIDDFNKVADYIRLASLNNELILRIHPAIKGENLNKYKMLCKKYNITLSQPKFNSLNSFLRKIDLLLACESYIHFEAVLSGIPSYYLKFYNEVIDNYGFLKEKFIEFISLETDPLNLSRDLNQLHMKYLKLNIENLNQLMTEKTYSTAEEYARIIDSDLLSE